MESEEISADDLTQPKMTAEVAEAINFARELVNRHHPNLKTRTTFNLHLFLIWQEIRTDTDDYDDEKATAVIGRAAAGDCDAQEVLLVVLRYLNSNSVALPKNRAKYSEDCCSMA